MIRLVLLIVGFIPAVGGEVYHDKLTRAAVSSDASRLSGPEKRRFLEAICPGHVIEAGCSVCPEGVSSTGASAVRPAWELETTIFGHFLNTESEDALVSGFGCESHAASYGGAFLFTKSGSAWKKVWYSPGAIAEDCKKLTASDGRDLLVCESAYRSYGGTNLSLYFLDAGRDPRKPDPTPMDKPDPLGAFFGVSASLSNCAKDPDGTTGFGDIVSVSFEPAPSYYPVKIIVNSRLGKADIPDSVLEKCGEGLQSVPKIRTVTRRYEFEFDGKKVMRQKHNPAMRFGFARAPTTSYYMPK